MKKNTPLTVVSFLAFFFNSAFSLVTHAEAVRFNPDDPIYIEYHPKTKHAENDLSLQVEDKKSTAKIRMSLQAKLDATSIFYGYTWLRIGKTISNEVVFKKVSDEVMFKRASNQVVFKKANTQELSGWLTEQDNLQALFLFDNPTDMAQFKSAAEKSKKPLTDKNSLPALSKPATATHKSYQSAQSVMGEAVKYGNMMNVYNKFTPAQKELNDKKAESLAAAGMKLYQKSNYAAAETQLTESLRLNPISAINKYYLALCFYQTQKYERSLALLSLAEGADYNFAEYKFYTGLNYLKLKNNTKAIDALGDVKEENDADYSAPAAFFIGHIHFQKEEYTLAKQNFEFTLDQSKDPKMDREAEAMIEKIDQIELLQNQMKQRFKYSLTLGFGYDSNILNVSTENQTTNLAAYRFLYGANIGYKLFHDMIHDMSIDLSFNDFYSLDNTLISTTTAQSADPQMMSVSAPYHRRIEFGQRMYSWGLLPSFQVLNMSLDGGSRKKILESSVLGTDLSFATSAAFYSRFFLEYAIDKSALDSTTPENEASAKKITISTTQTFITEPLVKRSWAFDLGYTTNDADGDNNDYNKLIGGLNYSQVALWNVINSLKLEYANTIYPKNPNDRSDTVSSLTYSLTKDLNKQLSLGLSGQYTLSSSSVDTYKYNKFNLQSVLTYSGAF